MLCIFFEKISTNFFVNAFSSSTSTGAVSDSEHVLCFAVLSVRAATSPMGKIYRAETICYMLTEIKQINEALFIV